MFGCNVGMCLYQAPDWRSWVVHIRTHQRLPCSEEGCCASFSTEAAFKRHLKTNHSDAVKYKCSVCPKLYARKDNAKRHVDKCASGGTLTTVMVGGDVVCPVTVLLDHVQYTIPLTVSASALVHSANVRASAAGSRGAVTSVQTSNVQPIVSARESPSTSGGISGATGGAVAVSSVGDTIAGKIDITRLFECLFTLLILYFDF